MRESLGDRAQGEAGEEEERVWLACLVGPQVNALALRVAVRVDIGRHGVAQEGERKHPSAPQYHSSQPRRPNDPAFTTLRPANVQWWGSAPGLPCDSESVTLDKGSRSHFRTQK